MLTTQTARKFAEHEKQLAVNAQQAAESEKRKTEALLYYTNINLAQREYEDLNIDHVREILDKEKDNPEAGFELGYLQQQCDLSLGNLQAHNAYLSGMALSQDGKWLLTGSKDHSAKMWDALSLQLKQTFNTSQSVSAVALTPAGARLATEDKEGITALWNVEEQTPRLLAEPMVEATSVAYSPDSRWFAVSDAEGVVQILDADTGDLRHTLQTNLAGVTSLAFLPDDKRLLIGTSEGAAQIWELASERKTVALRSGNGGIDAVNCMVASPDGKWVAVGCRDKTAHIFDAKTGAEPHLRSCK